MQHWTFQQWAVALCIAAVALVLLHLVVELLSGAASRAWHAEKEKHIKRVIETTKPKDDE